MIRKISPLSALLPLSTLPRHLQYHDFMQKRKLVGNTSAETSYDFPANNNKNY